MTAATDRYGRARRRWRWILAAFYLIAGIFHVATPDSFMHIMPLWVPLPNAVIIGTGICEILGAAALMVPRLQHLAGIMLALYAVCVFPANIKHALDALPVTDIHTSWWYHGPRLLLQPVIVWLALYCGGVVTWPMGRREKTFAPA
jgi:uncharacterized membrane protein